MCFLADLHVALRTLLLASTRGPMAATRRPHGPPFARAGRRAAAGGLVATRVVLSLLLLLLSLRADAAERIPAPGAHSPIHGCTNTCLVHDGSCIFGQNFDFAFPGTLLFVNKRNVMKTGWNPGTTGEVARWTSRYGSVTFNLMGYQNPFSGMNEAGLVGSSMYLPEGGETRSDARPDLAEGLWLQYQLDNFATVKEVLASEATVRRYFIRMHFLFCDRTGECATIEHLDGKVVNHTGPTLPVKALTNSTYEDSLAAWRNGRPSDDSLLRFNTAADQLSDYARHVEELRAANAKVDDAAAVQYAFRVQSSVSNPGTVYTAVFDTKNLRVHFKTTRDPRIREITLARLDFSGRTPVRMLDVHADVEGDISERLPAYSHEQSLAHSLAYRRAAPGIFTFVPPMAEEAVEVMLGWTEKWVPKEEAGNGE
jgi:choloylglycine hydrolase